jgi:hypothetical protein
MSSLAQTAGKNLFLRGFIAAVVVVSAFAVLVACRHLVSKDFPRLLSLDHEVRRELTRAERINLRTGVTCEEGMVLPDAGQRLCAIATFPEIFDRRFDAAPIMATIPIQFSDSELNHSTVLNL